mgnify:CR=1 FL=1
MNELALRGSLENQDPENQDLRPNKNQDLENQDIYKRYIRDMQRKC